MIHDDSKLCHEHFCRDLNDLGSQEISSSVCLLIRVTGSADQVGTYPYFIVSKAGQQIDVEPGWRGGDASATGENSCENDLVTQDVFTVDDASVFVGNWTDEEFHNLGGGFGRVKCCSS